MLVFLMTLTLLSCQSGAQFAFAQGFPSSNIGFSGYQNHSIPNTMTDTSEPNLSLPPSNSAGQGFPGPKISGPNFSEQAGTTVRGFVLLKNDHVIAGDILHYGEMYRITTQFGVQELRHQEIETATKSLNDLYQYKLQHTEQNSVSFIALAQWCVTNGLVQEADKEFDRAILWAKDRETAGLIREQKQLALAKFGQHQLLDEAMQSEKQKFLDWRQQIPDTTLTSFKKETMPLLIRNCSGIACHGPESVNKFRFAASEGGTEITLLKNFDTVLRYIDADKPDNSPVIQIPIKPHGRAKQIFTQRNLKQFEKFYAWVNDTAKEMPDYYPMVQADQMLAAVAAKRNQAVQSNPATGIAQLATFADRQSSNNPITSVSHQTPKPSVQPTQPASSQTLPNKPASNFDFFNQQSINFSTPPKAPASTLESTPLQSGGMTQSPTQSNATLFEKNVRKRQLERPPVDPFDPVLFNRLYHKSPN